MSFRPGEEADLTKCGQLSRSVAMCLFFFFQIWTLRGQSEDFTQSEDILRASGGHFTE